MTLPSARPPAPALDGPSYPRDSLERTQREHELSHALDAARLLSERLELAHLLGHIPVVRRIRDDVAGRLAELADVDVDPDEIQEEIGHPPDPNLEGDPAFNGAFGRGGPID